jgi:osmoprotectant transport system permease protein
MAILGQTLAWLTGPPQWSGPNSIPFRMAEHVGISAVSVLIALAIALPIGLWIGHTGRRVGLAVGLATLWRSLPSFAVIAIVLPITAQLDPQAGFKLYPTAIAMIVLAVPPIMVNAYTGVAGVEPELVEVGRGTGMTDRQLLTRVELPLATPAIVTGVRSGAIQIVATATLGAVFGFGGLGRYLVDGFAQLSRPTGLPQVLGGALLVVGLVIAVDVLFVIIGWLVTPRALRR